MKLPRISTLLLILLVTVAIYIDIPTSKNISLSLWGKTFETTISRPPFDLTILDKRFSRDFETKLGLDLRGGSHLVFEADVSEVPNDARENAVEGARNVIERRVNFFGVSEPEVRTVRSGNQYKIAVDLPGIENVSEAIQLIGATAQLDFREEGTSEATIATDSPSVVSLAKKTGLTGKHVKQATAQFSQQTGEPVVQLTFNSEGSKLFEDITARNINKQVGIFLDNFPLSAPVVQQKISGGEAVITGGFSLDEAKQLAISINSGSLPVPVALVEQRNIGPTLGQEQVDKSIFAGSVGLGGVILFMIMYYGKLGIIASVALMLYGIMSYALFRLIPVVLTLPGIAGFILSIGMAVDANILIFERIKEELRKGKEFNLAVRLGFGKAIDAIKDANLTTLLVAFILFNPLNWSFLPQFGMVRGFALTLGIGVATSLFTGVVITKRLINTFYRKQS